MKFIVSLVVGLLAFLGCAPAHASLAIKAESLFPPPFTLDDKPFVLGAIDGDSVGVTIKYLDAIKARGDKFASLIINSPGGSVFDGMELIRHIEGLGIPVHCHVDGSAMSMGFAILQACTTRTATLRSMLMAHEPAVSGMMSGKETGFRNIAEFLRVIRVAMSEMCAARMGMTVEAFTAKIDGDKEWWLSAREALAAHAVDSLG